MKKEISENILNCVPFVICLVENDNRNFQIILGNTLFYSSIIPKEFITNLSFLKDILKLNENEKFLLTYSKIKNQINKKKSQINNNNNTQNDSQNDSPPNTDTNTTPPTDTSTSTNTNTDTNTTNSSTSTNTNTTTSNNNSESEYDQRYISIDIGICQTLCLVGDSKFPIYRSIKWTMTYDCQNIEYLTLTGSFDDSNNENKNNNNSNFEENEFIDFFQNGPIALHWLSKTGHIIWANNTELETLGYTREEYIGHHIMEFCPEESENLTNVFERLHRGETIHNASFKFQTKCGEIKYLLVDSNVNFDDKGNFVHTRCFIRDDTERTIKDKILEEKRKAAQILLQQKDSFMRRVIHEIKTPLHILFSHIESISTYSTNEIIHFNNLQSNSQFDLILESELDQSQFCMNASQLIKHQVQQISNILENITFAQQFENNEQLKIRPIKINLPSMIYNIISQMKDTELKSGQKVHFHLENQSNLTHLTIDKIIHRALYNLIENSIRFSPLDNQLHNIILKVIPLSSSTSSLNSPSNTNTNEIKKNLYQFQLINTSPTIINLIDINKRFQTPYHSITLTPQSLSSVEGVGLGLYVASNIIQHLGGQLSCSNDGNQTTFQFNLELINDDNNSTITSLENSHSINIIQQQQQQKQQQNKHKLDSEQQKVIDTQENEGILEESTNNYSHQSKRSRLNNISMINSDTNIINNQLPPVLTPSPSNNNNNNNDNNNNNNINIKNTNDSNNSNTITTPNMNNVCNTNQSMDIKLPRILIVDDSKLCQKILIKFVNTFGYNYETASNGLEAVDILKSIPCPISVVLMDLRMPIMDGVTATKEIRKYSHLSNTPIIVVTAELGTEIQNEVFSSGANDYLPKPINQTELLTTLQKYL